MKTTKLKDILVISKFFPRSTFLNGQKMVYYLIMISFYSEVPKLKDIIIIPIP